MWHIPQVRGNTDWRSTTIARRLFSPLPFQFLSAHEELMSSQTCRNQWFPRDLYFILTLVKYNPKGMLKGFCVLYCSVCVCVFIPPLCEKKKLALKAILSFWSLWWNLWRGTARGLFCMSGRSASDCGKLQLTPYNTLAFSYIRQEGRGYDLPCLTAPPYSNSPVKTAAWLCVKLFACLEGP